MFLMSDDVGSGVTLLIAFPSSESASMIFFELLTPKCLCLPHWGLDTHTLSSSTVTNSDNTLGQSCPAGV
ncbi:hypothetical protein TNCV_1437011 [Trichonephila clavipes]|nr:hypothetical protein TNCV_1437011 [Trichonephila clavipes]